MDYIDVAAAKTRTGLRLVLTEGVPGPWSEAAKAVFDLRHVPYIPVAQRGGGENPELVAWTRHRNAPIAMFDDESPRVRWLEIVDLGERLGRGPSLMPADMNDRMLAVGLTNEICGEARFAWQARLLMLDAGFKSQGDVVLNTPMYRDYGYSETAAAEAVQRIQNFLTSVNRRVQAQRQAGSPYLIGTTLSLADVYWAYFSQLLEPLPHDQNPMPEGLRRTWGVLADALGEYPRAVIDQRNDTFANHLKLPLEF